MCMNILKEYTGSTRTLKDTSKKGCMFFQEVRTWLPDYTVS